MEWGFHRIGFKGQFKKLFSALTMCNMFLFTDIEFTENVLYDNVTKTWTPDSAEPGDETIEEPVIIMHPLDACFGHAFLDNCFRIFWVVQDLVQYHYIENNQVRIFIPERIIKEYPKQCLPLINEQSRTYIGGWQGLMNLLTPYPILFEHLLDKKYKFKKCFKYPENDFWQRAPFNCQDYYPERPVPKENIRFSDEVIRSKLIDFREHTLNLYGIPSLKTTDNLIIIDRKKDRKFRLLDKVAELAKENANWTFAGVHVLEDMTFREQVELFSQARIVIFRHGSAGCHLIWCQPHAIVFEIGGGPEGRDVPMIFRRLCQLTQAQHIYLRYDDFDPETEIFTFLKNQQIRSE